uniref:WAP domain-containing protein n=1 Tax=Podarcis muralis TaxID=64176 RepID=A0A670ILB9_PODMU
LGLRGCPCLCPSVGLHYMEKAGSCPILPYFCSIPEGDICSSDYDCPEKKKCCYLNCGKSCDKLIIFPSEEHFLGIGKLYYLPQAEST